MRFSVHQAFFVFSIISGNVLAQNTSTVASLTSNTLSGVAGSPVPSSSSIVFGPGPVSGPSTTSDTIVPTISGTLVPLPTATTSDTTIPTTASDTTTSTTTTPDTTISATPTPTPTTSITTTPVPVPTTSSTSILVTPSTLITSTISSSNPNSSPSVTANNSPPTAAATVTSAALSKNMVENGLMMLPLLVLSWGLMK